MLGFIKKNLVNFIGVFLLIILIFNYIYSLKRKNKKLDECSFYTIIHPIRMPDTHKLYFYFFYNKIKIESSANLSAEQYIEWKNVKHILSKRFLARIHCTEKYINRVYWAVPISDTLQNVPENGWKQIPYGFDKTLKE